MRLSMFTPAGHLGDHELVDRCLNGNRDAFALLVERYQNLVCALAFSACGNATRSEDLAQETFVTAWKELRQLRERTKFKSWLCGIARNVINSSLRREAVESARSAGPLESVPEGMIATPEPTAHIISREEETLVWNALEQIPETYREPLVLFYREGQSVRNVAQELDLSEDAVKQRLSRGREMLKEQVAALVETTLTASAPKKAFAIAVLAALPGLAPSAAAATVTAGAKGTVAAHSAAGLISLGAVLGPLIGLLGGYLGVKASIENSKSPRERAFMVKSGRITFGFVLAFVCGFLALVFFGKPLVRSHPALFATIAGIAVMAYVVGLLALIFWANRRQREIQLEDGTHWTLQTATPEGVAGKARLGFHYRTEAELLGLPLLHVCTGPTKERPFGMPVAKGWIAIGARAYGVLFAFGGIAVGGVAMGGLAAGLFPIGGLAIGVMALGGMACGIWAWGGFALGLFAFGGAAIAWKAALGGFALAKEIAVGGAGIAAHANDAFAKDYVANNWYFRGAQSVAPHLQWLWLLSLLPLGFVAWALKARAKKAQ